jgi:L-ascorbate metabolism protein UlaG (beta-lactamase superfamily)
MNESFLLNPELAVIRKDWKGNRLFKNQFMNADDTMPIPFKTALRWMVTSNPQCEEKKRDTFRLPIKKDLKIFSQKTDAFNWLGHASFLFRLDGKLLLTDPCLAKLPGVKRHVAVPFSWGELTNLDYILFTHTHRDHFDEESVRRILEHNPDVHFLVPLRMSPLLRKLGAKNITEAGWYQQFPLAGNLNITFLPAKHWNRRFLHDTNRELWGAFHLETKTQSIYFAGDTAYANHFEETQKLFPHIRHAFMPVGAYKPQWMMQSAHINPDEAVQGFTELGASHFIPMHFGTFDLSDEPVGEPWRRLQELKQNGVLKGDLLEIGIGETIEI